MRQQITDEGDPRKYWTQIPNIVFELGLKPLELVLYAHMKRAASGSGKCTKSTATLARETGMGAGTVSRTKTALETKRPMLGNRPLIRTREIPNPRGGKAFQEITITDIWKANGDYFASSAVEIECSESTSIMEVASSSMEIEGQNQVPVEVDPSSKPISTVEIKKNYKKNNKEEEKNSAHARLMAFHASNLIGPVPDAGAQGSAVKFLLEHYTPEECERVYTALNQDPFWHNTGVSWLLVRKQIGSWLKRESEPRQERAKAKTIPWGGRMYAVGDVIADEGEMYTVMGFDGTPTKQYRTPEAFARDSNRNLEEVKAKWN